MSVRAASLALVLALLPMAVAADVWKRVDANGVTHLSDEYLGPGSVLVMRTKHRRSTRASRPSASRRAYRQRVAQHTPLIEAAAKKYKLDPVLIHAVVRAESAYDASAVSHKGAVGLMQLMPGTARRYGVSDSTDPAQNLSGGIRYLRDLLVQFRSVSLALAAYNAGEGAVARNGNRVPPYKETREYVRKVIRFYREGHSKS